MIKSSFGYFTPNLKMSMCGIPGELTALHTPLKRSFGYKLPVIPRL